MLQVGAAGAQEGRRSGQDSELHWRAEVAAVAMYRVAAQREAVAGGADDLSRPPKPVFDALASEARPAAGEGQGPRSRQGRPVRQQAGQDPGRAKSVAAERPCRGHWEQRVPWAIRTGARDPAATDPVKPRERHGDPCSALFSGSSTAWVPPHAGASPAPQVAGEVPAASSAGRCRAAPCRGAADGVRRWAPGGWTNSWEREL